MFQDQENYTREETHMEPDGMDLWKTIFLYNPWFSGSAWVSMLARSGLGEASISTAVLLTVGKDSLALVFGAGSAWLQAGVIYLVRPYVLCLQVPELEKEEFSVHVLGYVGGCLGYDQA